MKCNKCGSSNVKAVASPLPGYTWQCLDCRNRFSSTKKEKE